MKGKKAILKKKTSNGARGSTSSLILVFKFFSNLWKLAKIYNIKVSLKLFSSYFIKTNNNCEVYEIWSCIRSLHDHGAKEWLFSRQMFGFVKSSLFMGNPCTHTLSLIHISEPTRPLYISYAVFCLKKAWVCATVPVGRLERR